MRVSKTKSAATEPAVAPRSRADDGVDRESTPRLRGLLESLADLVFVFDEERRFIFCNAAPADNRLLLAPEKFIGKRHDEVLPPDVDAIFTDAFERVKHGGIASFDYKLSMPDGEHWYAANVSALTNERGYGGSVAVVRDITQRHQAEAAIRDAEERFRILFEQMADPVFLVSFDGRAILDCNAAVETVFGYSREEFLKLEVRNIIGGDHMGVFDGCAAGEPQTDNSSFEARVQTKAKGLRDVEVQARPVTLRGVKHMLFIAHDITEPRRLEKSILDAAEMERRNLLFDLHDDLGQYLAGLQMAADALSRQLRREYPSACVRAEGVRDLAEAALGKLKDLVHGHSSLECGPVGLLLGLRRLAENVNARQEPPLVRVAADHEVAVDNIDLATQLYRIAEEAVTNAVCHAQASEVVISLNTNDERLRLEIVDDGNGNVVEGGEGMGLRIMRFRAGIVGCAFTLHGEPGRGTRIACSCPIPRGDLEP
jgi:PAS domain S-box-containing protein